MGCVYSTHGVHIPHILHTIHISQKDAPKTESGYLPAWTESCLVHHEHWEHHIWDRSAAEKFLQEHYEWFLPVWENYPSLVQQADALRALILDHFGGMYLDSDVQCLRNVEPFLRNSSLVLQAEVEGSSDGDTSRITNSVAASVRSHPFWKYVVDVLLERVNNSYPIYSTGPEAWSDALGAYRKTTGTMQQSMRQTVKVYPIKSFFFPCVYNDKECDVSLKRNLAIGNVDLNLAGIHRFLGLWDSVHGKHAEMIPAEVCSSI